jgi:hypothetical protein
MQYTIQMTAFIANIKNHQCLTFFNVFRRHHIEALPFGAIFIFSFSWMRRPLVDKKKCDKVHLQHRIVSVYAFCTAFFSRLKMQKIENKISTLFGAF